MPLLEIGQAEKFNIMKVRFNLKQKNLPKKQERETVSMSFLIAFTQL